MLKLAEGGKRSDFPEILTAEEVIRVLRLDELAPQSPRESLRMLVRKGDLQCLRVSSKRNGRMIFLRRHVDECLGLWAKRAEESQAVYRRRAECRSASGKA